jgi:hypothetical protein
MTTIVTRKRGPVPKAGRVRVTLYLDAETAEWGKHKDGGLSELVRRLLAEAKAGEEPYQDPYPPELRATYRRLIELKHRGALTEADEKELAATRDRINEIDRTTATWKRREQAQARLEAEITRIRCEIEAMP